MKRLKKILLLCIALAAIFIVYVWYVNYHSVNMTTRQKILKAVYPAWMWVTQLTGRNTTVAENKMAKPAVSFYSLQAMDNNNELFDFGKLKGKKILLVNTASECGYTAQYAELEKLYHQYKDRLEIIVFPANDFKAQEKGSDADIASFCKNNYGVSFPIMAKSVVVNTANQNAIYQWLTNPAANGWNSKAPSWNFAKYLIDEEGRLVNYFDPSISPLSKQVIQALQ